MCSSILFSPNVLHRIRFWVLPDVYHRHARLHSCLVLTLWRFHTTTTIILMSAAFVIFLRDFLRFSFVFHCRWIRCFVSGEYPHHKYTALTDGNKNSCAMVMCVCRVHLPNTEACDDLVIVTKCCDVGDILLDHQRNMQKICIVRIVNHCRQVQRSHQQIKFHQMQCHENQQICQITVLNRILLTNQMHQVRSKRPQT